MLSWALVHTRKSVGCNEFLLRSDTHSNDNIIKYTERNRAYVCMVNVKKCCSFAVVVKVFGEKKDSMKISFACLYVAALVNGDGNETKKKNFLFSFL